MLMRPPAGLPPLALPARELERSLRPTGSPAAGGFKPAEAEQPGEFATSDLKCRPPAASLIRPGISVPAASRGRPGRRRRRRRPVTSRGPGPGPGPAAAGLAPS
jgi:hypothetical protein